MQPFTRKFDRFLFQATAADGAMDAPGRHEHPGTDLTWRGTAHLGHHHPNNWLGALDGREKLTKQRHCSRAFAEIASTAPSTASGVAGASSMGATR